MHDGWDGEAIATLRYAKRKQWMKRHTQIIKAKKWVKLKVVVCKWQYQADDRKREIEGERVCAFMCVHNHQESKRVMWMLLQKQESGSIIIKDNSNNIIQRNKH